MRVITDMVPTAETQEIIYNASDTMHTQALYEKFDRDFPDWAKETARYSELMLGPVLTMMRRGVKIDVERRDKLVAGLEARKQKVAATFDYLCSELFGTPVNWNSTPQLKVLFYSFLGIPEQTKSKKGEVKVATDREVLERIAASYASGAVFANLILRIRDLEKQIEFLTKKLSEENRFHCSYNIAGTETFRLSSSEHPFRIGSNQQNIPAEARVLFVADPGYLFFQADQQGAEARLVAYKTGDENYIAACEGGDSHTMVAAMVFGFEPIRELAEREYRRGKSYRQTAKSGAHGSNYMGKPYTLAKQMGVETEAAEHFQANYFKKFPGIPEWHAWTARQIQTLGWLENPFGMRRIFWGRRWDDTTLREAIAFYPQSAVGVLTNIVLYKLWLKYEGQPGAPVQILMNGHDAAIGQIREDLAGTLISEVLQEMRFPFEVTDIHGKVRTVEIPFDMEVGRNWGKYDPVSNPEGLKKWTRTTT
jgi:DNA polymerase I-like protein with 3'-5' exonuclease and polymerase domains